VGHYRYNLIVDSRMKLVLESAEHRCCKYRKLIVFDMAVDLLHILDRPTE
jgi:hypothetical protein